MTNQEARQMFNDEVSFSHSSFCLWSEIICPSYPRLQTMMQLQCLTMTMTSKLSNPTLVAAGEGPAWKPHEPSHQNLKECLMIQAIQTKRRSTRMMASLDMFPCLCKVLSGWSLARWASYTSYLCYTHSFPSVPLQVRCCMECQGITTLFVNLPIPYHHWQSLVVP